ncbi:monovalent cation/H+ antiporter subunit D family protein [Limibaculum sp. M0105]|uniref:Monovalent cation/H+ antiporter subunit D family protein n=1 Tax=Thermohalobaculum xanthum TaxID=2753746 RepID=A0A8J7M5B0_9RHOB|nr:monovalent cation/H+ antiporter subunit D family protein [Thermohalobaculum xanthum]MBK0398085.1 monovalent cation/H+ antiporter subunit D family protein [Thermohalobaculum xanthum]
MTSTLLMDIALLLPFAGAIGIWLAGRWPNLREAVTLATAGGLFIVVITLLMRVLDGERPEIHPIQLFPGVSIDFVLEPLGMLFATVASTLWIVNSVYSIGYMRGNNEPRQTPFYICFAVAIGGAIGVSFAGNLLTLFLYYELLTLSTYPLVTHKGTDEAKAKGRVYLILLMGTSMLLMLPAIIWVLTAAGTTEFTPGGVLAGAGLTTGMLAVLYTIFMYGIGKAALMPVHFWLPAAMVAPTPVSALLHAVAVVKAGVFSVLKITVYIFGIDLLAETGASLPVAYIAGATVVLASMVALTRDNLKARLAYSTVSQLSYVVMAAAIATPAAVIGAAMHIAAHAVSKITLFFGAGAIYTAHHLTEVSQLDGIGRKMPITLGTFLIGSLSIIGLPPLIGVWSKWWIGVGGADADQYWVLAVLMISSLLNIAYLMPIAARGFFVAPPDAKPGEPVALKEAPIACLLALLATAALCLLLFFGASELETLLAEIAPVDAAQPPVEGEANVNLQ